MKSQWSVQSDASKDTSEFSFASPTFSLGTETLELLNDARDL